MAQPESGSSLWLAGAGTETIRVLFSGRGSDPRSRGGEFCY